MSKDVFDTMSLSYDQMVIESDLHNEFPFAGYQSLLSMIATEINRRQNTEQIKIVDLGVGTGNLVTLLTPERKTIYGVDTCDKMLEIAALKNPSIELFHHDFQLGLPKELSETYFDYIVATYAFHHIHPDDYINQILYLVDHLTPFGKLLIGDIFFTNMQEKEACHRKNVEIWDDSEFYYTFDWIASHIQKNLAVSFLKVSFCAGILIIEKYHEQTLQKPEVLVKY